jgi:PmbA protein
MIKEKFISRKLDYAVKITNSEIESLRSRDTKETGVRVFDEKQRLGLSAAVGEVDDSQLEKQAIENLDLGFKYDYQLEGDSVFEGMRGDESIVNPDYLISTTKDLLKRLTALSDKFSFSHSVSVNRSELTLINSQGLSLKRTHSTIGGAFLLKLLGSSNIMDGFIGFNSFNKLVPEDILADAEIIMNALLSDEGAIDQTEINVAFLDNEILQKFSSDISGDNYNLGSSLLSGRNGEKLFSEKITINDIYDHEDYSLYNPFDHEGYVKKSPLPIVEKGVLKTILFDKKNAAKFNAAEAGFASRSFKSNPGIANSFLDVTPTHNSLKEVTGAGLTLVPLMAFGGDFLPNGDYSTPVQAGLLLKDGVIVGRAPQVTISGNYLDLLSNEKLIAVCKNDLFKKQSTGNPIVTRMKISKN